MSQHADPGAGAETAGASLRDANAAEKTADPWRQAEERYRLVADNFPGGGVLMFDLDLRYTLVRGPSFEQIGLTGIEGKTVWEAFPPEVVARAEPILRQVLRGESSVAETPFAGRTYLVQRVPVRGAQGGIVAGMVLAQDISARVDAEAALRESEARYRLLFEKAGEAIYVVQAEGDALGLIVEANPMAARMHGYAVAEFVGTHLARLVPEGSASGTLATLHAVLEGGWRSGETVHVKRDGAPFPIEYTAGPFRAHGQRCVLAFVRDSTERRRAVDSLHEAKETAESASRELETFSYSVAHDLRAPLRGMSGFAQVLLDDYRDQLDADGVDCLEEIHVNARRMGALIDALLSLSRVTRGEIRPERVDVSAVARGVAAELAAAEPQRRVDLVIEDGLGADADPQLAHTLVENLLANAWKFTGKVAAPRIELGATREDGATVFFVRDNGAGFDMAYADKLFAPFQRLHTVGEFPGTGIGLATVQRIVHRHGGRVWAEGAVGAGATFHFTLAARSTREAR